MSGRLELSPGQQLLQVQDIFIYASASTLSEFWCFHIGRQKVKEVACSCLLCDDCFGFEGLTTFRKESQGGVAKNTNLNQAKAKTEVLILHTMKVKVTFLILSVTNNFLVINISVHQKWKQAIHRHMKNSPCLTGNRLPDLVLIILLNFMWKCSVPFLITKWTEEIKWTTTGFKDTQLWILSIWLHNLGKNANNSVRKY